MRSSALNAPVLVLVVLATLAGGCVPKVASFREVELAVPESYDALPVQAREQRRREEVLGDPQLVALVDAALANNRELGLLDQEVLADSAEILARRGEFLPRLDLGTDAGVERVGRYTSQGASDASTEIEPGKEVPENLGLLRGRFRASWEIDAWGKLRNRTRAARLRYLSSVEGRSFVATQIVAEVADGYFDLVALDAQLEVVRTNVQLLDEGLQAARLQKEAGRVTELAVQRFDAELLKNQSREVELRQRRVEVENRLNVLCGRFPTQVARDVTILDAPPAPALPAGAPAELLASRPDIRAAELELEASRLDVKAARALFYPSFALDAEAGVEAFSLARLASLPESLLYDVVGSAVGPLLNRKALKAEYLQAHAGRAQAVLAYEQTVLQAYAEVNTQLNRTRNLDESARLRTRQVERLEQAIQTSSDLFRSARADWLEVLTTRREALEAQMELIETRRDQLQSRVALYQALGGGWQQPADRTP